MNMLWMAQLLRWLRTYGKRETVRQAWSDTMRQLSVLAETIAPWVLINASIVDGVQPKDHIGLYIPNVLFVLLAVMHWIRQWMTARNNLAWEVDFFRSYNERDVALALQEIKGAIDASIVANPKWWVFSFDRR